MEMMEDGKTETREDESAAGTNGKAVLSNLRPQLSIRKYLDITLHSSVAAGQRCFVSSYLVQQF